jgi:hypothetical protein
MDSFDNTLYGKATLGGGGAANFIIRKLLTTDELPVQFSMGVTALTAK